MATISSLFLDSSILIEYERGNKTDLLDYLGRSGTHWLFVSETVLSEYTFHLLAFGAKRLL